MASDEDYLEGLRDADKQRHLQQTLGSFSNEDEYQKARRRVWQTETNWDQITPGKKSRDEEDDFKEETRRIPDESEYLPGMSSQELHPITPDDHNVSKQLAEHVDKISSMVARRPPKDYEVRVVPGRLMGKNVLVHKPTGEEVGDLSWWKDDGHVNWLGVEPQHRHMTAYLLAQSWNDARGKGEVGPASSDNLSPYSEKIVRKYNPDSQEFKQFEANKNESCSTCLGEGEIRSAPRSFVGGRYVTYHTGNEYDPILTNNRINSMRVALDNPGRTSYGQNILHPDTNETYHWPVIHSTCPTCQGTGERQPHE